MGLFDALSGKTYALNTVLKPASNVFADLAKTFPERDFFRDYFGNLGWAAMGFCQLYFETDSKPNLFKDNIKNISPENANVLMKLIGIHVTLVFTSIEENVVFLQKLNITPEIIMGYLVNGLSFTEAEIELFKDLLDRYQSDQASYSVGWGIAFYNLVLGKTGVPGLDSITRIILSRSFGIFMEFFKSKH